jgi:hypothetical protein
MHNKINNASVYGNNVNGSNTNYSSIHEIMLGNQSGGNVYSNTASNVYIGFLAKGETGGLFNNNISTNTYYNGLRSKASTGTKFYNNTAILNTTTGIGQHADNDSVTGIVSTGADFRNNIIYSDIVPTYFDYVGVGSSAVFHSNEYYSPNDTVSIYQSSTYNNIDSWKSTVEVDLTKGNPLLTSTSTIQTPTYLSPAIDAGTTTSTMTSPTTDFAGHPIYGTPDIGAFEYQPPFTIGTSLVDPTGNIRIYGDGKYRYTTATSSTMLADCFVAPPEGTWTYAASTTRPEWLNISSITGYSGNLVAELGQEGKTLLE